MYAHIHVYQSKVNYCLYNDVLIRTKCFIHVIGFSAYLYMSMAYIPVVPHTVVDQVKRVNESPPMWVACDNTALLTDLHSNSFV